METNEDYTWSVIDPLGRRVVNSRTIDAKRIESGKHSGPDAMTSEEARICIEQPDRIDTSISISARNIYYKYQPEDGKPPYKRAVVSFEQSTEKYDGKLISYSRYRKPVRGNTIYPELRNNS